MGLKYSSSIDNRDLEGLLSRAEARKKGLRFYKTKPCCHGHFSVRYATTTRCLECEQSQERKQAQRGYDKIRRMKTKASLEKRKRESQQRLNHLFRQD